MYRNLTIAAVIALSLNISSADAQESGRQLRLVPADERPRLEPGVVQLRQESVSRQAPPTIYFRGAFYQRVEASSPSGVVQVGNMRPGSLFRPGYALRPTSSAMPSGYQYGRGIIGQPKLYVPGQPVRNLLRFITP